MNENLMRQIRLQNIFMPPINGPAQDPGFYKDVFGDGMGGIKEGKNPFQDPNFFKPAPITNDSGFSESTALPPTQGEEEYSPENEASQRYSDMINSYPNKGDYKPRWWERIAAAVIDFTKGHQAGQNWFNAPYNEAVKDWSAQTNEAQQAANLERYQNVNERTMKYQGDQTRLREKQIDEKSKKDERDAQIRQQRADVYEWKSKHPNHKIITPGDGHVYAINPVDNAKIDLGIDTLSEKDKYDLQQEHALERIGATGSESRKTEETRQENRTELEGIRQTGREKIQSMRPPTGATNRPMLPNQVKADRFNKALQIKESVPELSKFVKINASTNDIDVIEPGTRGGPTQQQYDAIVKHIWGPTGGGISTQGSGLSMDTNKVPPAPKGWKYVPKEGGGWTAIPDKEGM